LSSFGQQASDEFMTWIVFKLSFPLGQFMDHVLV
jgi:hypothetical protein